MICGSIGEKLIASSFCLFYFILFILVDVVIIIILLV